LEQIKEFYQQLQDPTSFDPKVLEQLKFYGGTVPYVAAQQQQGQARKFGDVDIFVPIQIMGALRNYLQNVRNFDMGMDGQQIARKHNLTIYNPRGNSDFAEQQRKILGIKKDDSSSFNLFASMMSGEFDSLSDEELGERFGWGRRVSRPIQDFGFKGNLFGVDIAVYPIYQWKDGSIYAKSFRTTTEEDERGHYNEDKPSVEQTFLMNTEVVQNYDLAEFFRKIQLNGGIIGAVKPEYTIASKTNAIEHGYRKREQDDQADIDFMYANKQQLGIQDEEVAKFKKQIPLNGVKLAYRIKRGGDISTKDGDSYKNLVTTEYLPS